MQMDWRAVVVALFLVLLVGTASLLSQASSSLYSQFEVLAVMPVSGWVDTTGWHSYENKEYGFQIKYPVDFISTEDAYELVTSGAVVTFVPTFDPSTDGTGAKTNLYNFSVTIGVTDAPVALLQQDASCSAYAHERRLNGLRKVGSILFATYYFSEGAVGNRYEKLSYRTACGDTCYEIALFVHYGNPYCYSPGAITIFDPTEILRLFDTMVGTFLTATRDCYRSGGRFSNRHLPFSPGGKRDLSLKSVHARIRTNDSEEIDSALPDAHCHAMARTRVLQSVPQAPEARSELTFL